ncbi:MAG: DUF2520 domain-containing protein [Betaproteobacteria bacterium]|nr:DUF2520 domain-containing protein [Betaproteobacteria bacterium]
MEENAGSTAIAFIGAGRLATGLALAMHAAGAPVQAVASRSPASARALAERIPGCIACSPKQAVENAGLVFLSVPDDAIAGVAGSLAWTPGQAVVHCSGATEISALADAAGAGAATGGFHPLQTFTDPVVALSNLPGCSVAIEAAEPLFSRLTALTEAIGCRPFALPPGARARYHATGSYAAQFVNALLLEASAVWESFGMDRAAAVRALLPLLKGTVAAIEHGGLVHGLAGPVSRGDAGTVRRQLEGIATLGADHLALFRELTRLTLPLAIERGTLTPSQVASLRALLDTRTQQP